MTEQEIKNYQSLSKAQKEMADALKNIGFKYKFSGFYERQEWGEINLNKVTRWSELITLIFNLGSEAKRQEIAALWGIK